MRIARIFDLLDADNRSAQLETKLKQASDIWGSPTEDVFAMMVWLKMLAEREHYTSLIEGARCLFIQELESVETIENAYRALPPAFILEPLHSQGLRSCRDARLNLVVAIKAINQQYQRNQDDVSKDAEAGKDEAAEGRQLSQFQDMHTAFLEFYGDMDEIEVQVLELREVARASAAELSPILEQAKGQLEEQHAQNCRYPARHHSQKI